MMSTPTEQLSNAIVDALCEAGLVRMDKKKELQTKLSAGTTTEQDWRSVIEADSPKEVSNDVIKA